MATDYKKKWEEAKNRAKEERVTSPSSSAQSGNKYKTMWEKAQAKAKIGLDTFDDDLASVSTQVNTALGGWQTEETMRNTKESARQMYKRIEQLRDYTKQYGNAEDMSQIDALYESYGQALGTWDDRMSQYSQHPDATSYEKAMKMLKLQTEYSGLSYEQVQEEKKKYAPDSDEYRFFDTYTDYADLTDYDKALDGLHSGSGAGRRIGKGVTEEEERISKEESDKAREERTKYADELRTKAKQYELDHTFDRYRGIMEEEGFAEKSQYVPTKGTDDEWWQDTSDATYEFINDVNGARMDIISSWDAIQAQGTSIQTAHPLVQKGYQNMNEDEIAVYNALYADDPAKAQAFLDDMEKTLTKRGTDEKAKRIAESDGGILSDIALSIASVPMSIGGGLFSSVDALSSALSGEEYNPYGYFSSVSNAASDIRKTVGDDIEEATDLRIGNVNVARFLYDTGMSMGDSALGVVSMGKALSPIMGTTAYQQKARELTEAGATEEQIQKGALASGFFEMLFEKASIDKLLKAPSVDSLGKMVRSTLTQAGVEASEEMATETANILFDWANRQNTSDVMQTYNTYVENGYSEFEAFMKTLGENAGQVVWSGIGGALSGGAMGSVKSGANYVGNRATGQQIRANDRVDEMLDIRNMTPEEADAYKLYTELATKGINADNITDAQLGNLYATTERDVYDTVTSKKTTVEQKADALQRSKALETVRSDRPATEKEIRQRARELQKLESETEVAEVESIKVEDGKTVLQTADGEVSVAEAKLSETDAGLVAYAETMSETKANLFLSQYDGKSSVDDYATAFELAYHYGELGFGEDTVLKNKGVLTEAQAFEAYKAGTKDAHDAREQAIESINEYYGKTVTIKGKVDDSIIDYDSTTSDGSKVNWSSLTSKQRDAVKFVKAFSSATGVNVRFIQSEVKDGKRVGKNGSYSRDTNLIEIDVYAGIDAVEGAMEDAIIPTLSHELTHWMEKHSAKAYRRMSEYILDTFSRGREITAEDLIAEEKARIKKAHPELGEISDDYAIGEIVARACEDMLTNSQKARELLDGMSTAERNTFVGRVKQAIKNLRDWVNDLLGQYKSKSREASILRNYDAILKNLSAMWDEALSESIRANQKPQTVSEKRDTTSEDIKHGDRTSIREGMSDAERYAILKDKAISLIAKVDEEKMARAEQKYGIGGAYSLKETDRKKLFKKLGEEFGVFKEYENSDVELTFVFSRSNMSESERKQGGNYELFAKMFSCFDDVIESAVGIEIHNRNNEGYKPDVTLKSVYVLVSAFEDGENIVPVKLEIKEFVDKNNALYVAIALESIKKDEVAKEGNAENGVTQTSRSPIISLADLFTSINPSDERFLKYVPKQFFEQVKRTDNLNSTDDVDMRFMDRETEYQTLSDEVDTYRKQHRDAEKELRGYQIPKINYDAEDVDAEIETLRKWETESGYGEVSKRAKTIKDTLRDAERRLYALAEELRQDMFTAFTEEDVSKYASKAVRKYHTTSMLSKASYLTTTGSMLDFSDGQRYRVKDHREISEILDLPDYAEYSDGMIVFMNMGNIRLQEYGIDVSAMPNSKQISALRSIISKIMNDNGEFYLDVSDYRGNNVFNMTYGEKTSVSRIIADIQNYFNNGTIPEQPSELSMFYSDRDSEGTQLTEGQQKFFAESKVRDEQGRLIPVFHGTSEYGFTVFDPSKSDDKRSLFFTDNYEMAQSYVNDDDKAYKVYLNLKNPMVVEGQGRKWNRIKMNKSENEIVEKSERYIELAQLWDMEIDFGTFAETLGSLVDSTEYILNESEGDIFTEAEKEEMRQLAREIDEAYESWNAEEHLDEGGDETEFARFLSENRSVLYRTRQIAKMAQEQGYDGVIIKDLQDNGRYATQRGVWSVGNVYIAFESNQVKNVTNENPTEDADIRYADREMPTIYDVLGENEALRKQNDKLRADIDRLKERLALEKKLTKGNTFNQNQLRAVAQHLRSISNSTYAESDLVADLNEVYSYIVQTPNLMWDDLFAQCYDVARRMLDEQRPTKETNDYFKSVLSDIRKARISLSEEQIQEAKSAYGERYRDAFMGRVTLAKNGISLDTMWQEWSSMYPEIFDAEVTGGDQITALSDIYDSLREGAEVFRTYNDVESIRALASEIYNQYWNVSTVRTTSDKYDAQIKRLNYEHRKTMGELREDHKQKLERQEKADAIYYGRIINQLRTEREKRVKEAKRLGKERMDEYKDRIARNAKIQSITKKSLTLAQWLSKNSKDAHIPEIMKAPVAYLIDSIDFSSKQLLGMTHTGNEFNPTKKDISLSKALEQVHNMVSGISNAQIGESEIAELYGTFADFPPGFAEDVQTLSAKVNDIMRTVGDNAFILNQMALEELETLDKIVTTLKATVSQMNQFLAVRHAEGVANLSQESMVYMDSLGKAKDIGKFGKLINWGNALPYYTFKRFGSGGMKVYEALQDGWDTFAFHVKEIIDYSANAYTEEEVKAWSEEIHEFDVLEPATEEVMSRDDYKPTYQKVKMTVPQIMSLYCTAKREQSKGHIFGGGIRVADIKIKKDTISQSEGFILSDSELATIIASLTPRQMEVADTLQAFMNTTCTEWGNAVSMRRFGYKAFGEENYFPLQSDRNNLAVNDETEQNNSLFRLLNMSFTKSTITKANNRIVISDIFDVFAKHTSDMAKYNALALPVLDAFKWYNYKEKANKGKTQFVTKSLKQSLENAFGKDGQDYFVTFLRDINGEQSAGRDVVGKGFVTNAKIASVGFNLKVIALQPTSYVRASAVIDNKYLVEAFTRKPKMDMAEKYCGIALWKSLGFFDINVQNSVSDLIKHNSSLKDKIIDVSMKGAEKADKLTWGYLWNACEYEVRDTHPNMAVGSEEYYETVAKRLREVIYATQVVDTTMTRSHMMRSKAEWDKMATAFMSEPTLAYNMLQDCYYDWMLTKRQTGDGEKAFKKHGKKMARVFTSYVVTNAVAALVEAGFEIFRDDEEEELTEEEIMKKWWKNFNANASILGKIPYLKELSSILQGYSSSRMDTQWMQYFSYSISGVSKLIEGKGNAYTTAKNMLRAISSFSGLPIYNAFRDTIALGDKSGIVDPEDLEEMFNDTIGDIFPSLKSK